MMTTLLALNLVLQSSGSEPIPFDLTAWKAINAQFTTSKLSLSTDGVLRLDYDYNNKGGYALVERAWSKKLPENYEFSVEIKADSPRNNFEFKLSDPGGENVWWVNQAGYDWPSEWRTVTFRKRAIGFAWGPKPGNPDQIGSLQFGVAANVGGKGTLWFRNLKFTEKPAIAGFSQPKSVTNSASGTLVDLGAVRELGAARLAWGPGAKPTEVVIEASSSRDSYQEIARAKIRPEGHDTIMLPNTEARSLRIRANNGTAKVRAVRLYPVEAGDSLSKFVLGIAGDEKRGLMPRHLLGEGTYWTVVGAPNGDTEGLFSEDGQLEPYKGGPMLEPFLVSKKGQIESWATQSARHQLLNGELPIPSYERQGPVKVKIEPLVTVDRTKEIRVRYTVTNVSKVRYEGALALALRPFQVNPSWQSLNYQGGISAIREAATSESTTQIGDKRLLEFDQAADECGVSDFQTQSLEAALRAELKIKRAQSELGLLSTVHRFELDLKPGQARVIHARLSMVEGQSLDIAPQPTFDIARSTLATGWNAILGPTRIEIAGPDSVLPKIARSQISYIAINRDGPSTHPGSRNYERSWIRDGALTCGALMQWGEVASAKRYLDWYSGFVQEDGYVPCIVDKRGPDSVPEHDSHGQFLHLAHEYLTYSGDRATIERIYPVIQRVVGWVDRATQENRTPGFLSATDEKRGFYGMLPPSISHEGYAQPKHSYWDNFFALRGLRDAAAIAFALGKEPDANTFAKIAAMFEADLVASINHAQKFHQRAYIPGCAELGDFDATSTAIGIHPGGMLGRGLDTSFNATFAEYWKFFENRRLKAKGWRAYTPYEIRNVTALLMLGEKEKAYTALKWFMRDLLPQGWNAWPEVGFENQRTGSYLGDIPHTWVGSEFLRAFRSFFVYDDEADASLVVGAGVQESWLAAPVKAQALQSSHGRLTATASRKGNEVTIQLSGDARPPGGFKVYSPLRRLPVRATVNSGSVQLRENVVIVHELPATITFRYPNS